MEAWNAALIDLNMREETCKLGSAVFIEK